MVELDYTCNVWSEHESISIICTDIVGSQPDIVICKLGTLISVISATEAS